MAFNPNDYITKVRGQDYLEVKWRIVWFRQDHPNWGIETNPVEINTEKQYAIFRAKILNQDGEIVATGTKAESKKGFADYLEKAETGAIGRALALAGYGTQFAPDFVEGDRLADSPVSKKESNATPSTDGKAPILAKPQEDSNSEHVYWTTKRDTSISDKVSEAILSRAEGDLDRAVELLSLYIKQRNNELDGSTLKKIVDAFSDQGHKAEHAAMDLIIAGNYNDPDGINEIISYLALAIENGWTIDQATAHLNVQGGNIGRAISAMRPAEPQAA